LTKNKLENHSCYILSGQFPKDTIFSLFINFRKGEHLQQIPNILTQNNSHGSTNWLLYLSVNIFLETKMVMVSNYKQFAGGEWINTDSSQCETEVFFDEAVHQTCPFKINVRILRLTPQQMVRPHPYGIKATTNSYHAMIEPLKRRGWVAKRVEMGPTREEVAFGNNLGSTPGEDSVFAFLKSLGQ
jgi:hypothetical protein